MACARKKWNGEELECILQLQKCRRGKENELLKKQEENDSGHHQVPLLPINTTAHNVQPNKRERTFVWQPDAPC
jgi:hypothetical protein